MAQTNQLNYFVETGLQNSPLLRDFQSQQELLKYDSLLLRASFKPQVNGAALSMVAPVIKGWGYDAAITNERQFLALIGVNKQLLNKKNLSTQFENFGLQSESLYNTSKLTEQDLKRTIIGQYIIAYGSLMQLNFAKEVNTLLTNAEQILKNLLQSNVYKQVDYLSFLVTHQQQEFQLKQQHIQYNSDLATLQYICGIVMKADEEELQNPSIILTELPDITHSIFFKQFELDSLKLENNKLLLNINYRPKINIFADAGYNSSFAVKAYKNIGTSFGINASIPIYDGKKKQLEWSKIDIAERTQTKYKTFFTKQHEQQIAQLKQQLSATESLLGDINSQLKYVESLIEVNGKLLEAGEAKMTDYILALNSYINTKNLITQNEISRMQIINQLNYWNK